MATDKRIVNQLEVQIDIGNDTFVKLLEVENAAISLDQNKEEWSALGDQGWTSNLITTKSLAIAIQKKYVAGNTADAFITTLLQGNAIDQNGISMKILFPPDVVGNTGAIWELNGSINITSAFGGDASATQMMEFDLSQSGIPTFVAETPVVA